MKKKELSHTFSFFYPLLQEAIHSHSGTIAIRDDILISRLSIIRARAGEKIILFDSFQECLIIITLISRKLIEGSVESCTILNPLSPTITLLLPLLKKSALEESIYSAVEIGATSIHLIVTQKTHRAELDKIELERLKKIAIAAAEQSKQFLLPVIHMPQQFNNNLLKELAHAQSIFFDPDGQKALSVFSNIAQASVKSLMILCGPEGDLTLEEKEILRQFNVTFCALTPTVLRAQQAIALGLGMVRSLL